MKSMITMPSIEEHDNLVRLNQTELLTPDDGANGAIEKPRGMGVNSRPGVKVSPPSALASPPRPAIGLTLARVPKAQGLLLLLVSTAFAEVAGSAVYVILIERAYQLGSGTTSAGIVLLVQSATQAILGFGAGSLADTWGYRKTAMIAGLVVAALAVGLAFTQTILFVYLLAILLMMARLLLLPARYGLVPQLSNKSQFVQANSALALLSGAGGFVGPAMVTALLLLTDSITSPLLVTAVGSILSILPLALISVHPASQSSTKQINVWSEMRLGWQVIRRRSTIRQLLLCLINVALLLAAVTPLFTLLARRFGLGSEGTGALFTALGFGYMIGPLLATALFKRMRLSNALLLSGLVGPVGAILVGIPQRLETVLVAVALIAIAGASVNVLVLPQWCSDSPLESCKAPSMAWNRLWSAWPGRSLLPP
jgi:MFS family permease